MNYTVNPRNVLATVKAGGSAKDVGLGILADSEESGNAWEQALDWGLGLAAVKVIGQIQRRYNRLPKPFTIEVDAQGNCVAAHFSTKTIAL